MRRSWPESLAMGLCALIVFGGGNVVGAGAPAVSGISVVSEEEPIISGKPLSFWIRMLKDKAVRNRLRAVVEMAKIGPGARPALPALIEALRDEDPEVYTEAFVVLLQIDPKATTMASVFLAQLRDDDADVRAAAATHLGQIADLQPNAALNGLCSLLHDRNEEVRVNAVVGLYELRHKATSAVPDLIEALHDDSPTVRRSAVAVLRDIGPEAKQAVVPLCIALREDESLRPPALGALLDFGDDVRPGVPILLGNLNHNEVSVRLDSAWVLARFKPEAHAAVAPLCEILLHDPDEWQRRNAGSVLGTIGADAKTAVPALLLAMKDESARVRVAAARALVDIDPETADQVLNHP